MASGPEFRPVALLRRLAAAQLDLVVIGGVAVAAQGYARTTRVLDIAYATDAENLERLGGVLLSLHARLRGVADDVPFVPDARTLRHVQILTLDTDDGGLDLLVDPAGAARSTSWTSRRSRRRGACATRLCASLTRRDGEPADTHHAAAARRDPRADVPAHGLPLTRPR